MTVAIATNVLSAGNYRTCAKRGKMSGNQITVGFVVSPDWLEKLCVALIGLK